MNYTVVIIGKSIYIYTYNFRCWKEETRVILVNMFADIRRNKESDIISRNSVDNIFS